MTPLPSLDDRRHLDRLRNAGLPYELVLAAALARGLRPGPALDARRHVARLRTAGLPYELVLAAALARGLRPGPAPLPVVAGPSDRVEVRRMVAEHKRARKARRRAG